MKPVTAEEHEAYRIQCEEERAMIKLKYEIRTEENKTLSSNQSVQRKWDEDEEKLIRERIAKHRSDAKPTANGARQCNEDEKRRTEEGLELIRSGVLPEVDASIMLESDETCHLEVLAVSRVSNLSGRFIATNKRLIFLYDSGGFELQWRRIVRIELRDKGIYLESTTKKGNGYYKIEEPTISEAIFTSLKLMSNGQLVSPQIAMHRHQIAEIDSMLGLDFEHYVATLLTFKGYSTKVTKGSHDFGVDIVAEKDGFKYAVQVKRYNQPISRRAISDAVTGKAPYDCHSAMVITNNYFTNDAKKLAQATGCELIDRKELTASIMELQEHEKSLKLISNSEETTRIVETQSEGSQIEVDGTSVQKPADTLTDFKTRNSLTPQRGTTVTTLYLGGKRIEAGTLIWILSSDSDNYKIEYKNNQYSVVKSVILLDT